MLIKVGPRGQITIPKSYRKSLNIEPGDSVVIIQAEGQLYLRPVPETIFNMRGAVQVSVPQDLEAVLEETKKIVARQIAGSLNNE